LIERTDEYIDATLLPAYVAELDGESVGMMTLLEQPDHIEIMTLNSFVEDRGIGTALIATAESETGNAGLDELRVFTGNHNIRAIGFYQRRGFRLWAVHRDTITRARLLKPTIPLEKHGILICDEVELRKRLPKHGLDF
jgi:GNAT superfamily N-acetyltransferase